MIFVSGPERKFLTAAGTDVSNVSQLSRTADGALAAWVSGRDEYSTMVRRKGETEFDFICTCPYDGLGPCLSVNRAAAGQPTVMS